MPARSTPEGHRVAARYFPAPLPTGRIRSAMKEQLERLVDEMVTRGVHFEDAQREFEKRFIAHVLVKADGNLCKAADLLGMHRNTLSRKMHEYRLRRRSA